MQDLPFILFLTCFPLLEKKEAPIYGSLQTFLISSVSSTWAGIESLIEELQQIKDDEKNSHSKELENARENLQLFKANLMDFDGHCVVIVGCSGAFHVTCPVLSTTVTNPKDSWILRDSRNLKWLNTLAQP